MDILFGVLGLFVNEVFCTTVTVAMSVQGEYGTSLSFVRGSSDHYLDGF
jgi:hypothetical protein